MTEVALKRIATVIAGQSPPSADVDDYGAGLPFLQGNAEFGSRNPTPRHECDIPPKRCRSGDILLSVRAPVGALNVADRSYGIGRGLCAVRTSPDVSHPEFLWWALTARVDALRASATGSTYEAVTADVVGGLSVPRPSLLEQRAIADFLDTETARIDALIAKKRHMMNLLKDRLAACIRRAISEGLTSSELRETDVAVVPRLPIHWELTRARFVCRVETGDGDTVQAMEDGDYPFFVRSDTVERSDKFLFDTEAVLTAGDGAGVAKVFHHYSGKFNAHQRVYVMHEFRRVLGRYYYYCLRTLFPLVALDGSAKSTVDSVRRYMLTDMPVPLPPLEEQAQIVRALDQEVARAGRILGALEKQLHLLNEHRQALVEAAVTGEFAVRRAAS